MGAKMLATLERTMCEVPTRRNGRIGYRWAPAVFLIRPDGTKEYPPIRIRDAQARCKLEGWAYQYADDNKR